MYSNRLRCIHILSMCVVFILAIGWSNVQAQCVMTFDDEAAFLAMTQTPDMESFEALTASNNLTTDNFSLPGFDLAMSPGGDVAGVYNRPERGAQASDGVQYIRYRSEPIGRVTFSFDAPKTAFGVNISDWGEGDMRSAVLTFMNDAGDSFVVQFANRPEGELIFFGVINYKMPFTQVILEQNSIIADAYGIDEVYCEFLSPPPTIMACKNINVSLNEDCYVKVVPSMVLSGFFPCYDDFIVELDYHGKKLPTDTIWDDHIGDIINAKIIDTTSGNSCWAEVLVEDKFAPEVLCMDDTVNCIEYKMHYDTPAVVEQCQLYTIKKTNELITTIPCDSNYIKRIDQTFVATDEQGNVSQECSRTIYIERFPLDEVKCPEREVTLYCNDNYLEDANDNPHPDVVGKPYLFSRKKEGGQLFASDNMGHYYSVDFETGDLTEVTDDLIIPGICRRPGLTEIEFDPASCLAVGMSNRTCGDAVHFDWKSGSYTGGEFDVQTPFQGAEVIDGTWYVSSEETGSLHTFDPISGATTSIGVHALRSSLWFSGLAFDGTTLYGCEGGSGTGLYTIDLTTGLATLVGDMMVNLGSLEFGPDGNLYGGGGQSPYQGNFYRVYTTDGSATLVGATGLTNPMTGLMWVPEVQPLYPQPDFFCNLWVDYRDTDLGKVGCDRKIMRTWEIQEWWCTKDTTITCTQMIYIRDTVGPVVRFPADSIYAKTNTGFHTCEGDVWIPEPFAQDACHSIDRIDLNYPGGFIKDWQGEKITLPTGFHTVYATGYDSCYNSTLDSIIVHVEDKIAPIAICDQNTVVSLDNDGIVHVYADAFDDGSFDECVIKEMHVRRMDDPCGSGTDEWGDYVEFCCADVNQEIMVSFRVTDKSGNSGTCMVNVLVNDKLPPRVVCPPDITVDCRFDWDPNNLDVFGSIATADSLREPIIIDSDTVRFDGPAIDGFAEDNCHMFVVDSMNMDSIDNCGGGVLRRYFMVTDAQGQVSQTCLQRITFVNPEPFTERNINWPDDLDTVNVCTPIFFEPDFLDERYAYPTFDYEEECSLVGHTYKDHLVTNTPGAFGCFKILRKWKVIDWCQYDGTKHKTWEHEQVILVENDRAPFINTDCADTVHCFYTNDCTSPPFTLTQNAIDDCTPRDELFWQYKIDLGNDGSFDITGNGNSVTDTFAADTHLIKWFVEDLCGNETTCEYTFELRNCKAPQAYCKPGVILELTPMDLDNDGTPDTEMAELWASDLDDGSSHECDYDVTFSFSQDTSDKVRWYDCDSIGLRTVNIYVTDRTNGNFSICITNVTIQDNNNVDVCPQTANGTISGLVMDRDARAILSAEGQLPGAGMPGVMTANNGMFAFAGMPYGGQYDVQVRKDDDVLNGVTTADLLRIQRHLLGIDEFDQPWKYIAGDVNMNGEVSSADLSDIRKVILGVKDEFASQRSWRFVDANYQFQNPLNPLQENFTEVIELTSFDQDIQTEWTGVKLGDIDNSVDPQGYGSSNQTRSQLVIHAEDQEFDKGEEGVMIVDAGELDQLEAIQFTLEVNTQDFEIIEVVPMQQGMDYSHFNVSMKHLGLLTVAWPNVANEEPGRLFAIRLRALNRAQLSDAVQMSGDITSALAYVGGVEYSLDLRTVDMTAQEDNEFALFQNVPNPWSESTELSFYLPHDRNVQLNIMDANGRVVWSRNDNFDKGYHRLQVKKSDIPSTGVYYYQIQTEDFVASRKMLIL